MCYAYNALSTQIQQLHTKLGKLSEELSFHDKALTNFNHELEAMNFDESESYNIAKTLQDILLKRRRTKYEIHQIRSLKTQLENVEFKLKENEKKFQKENPHNWDRVIHSSEEKTGKDLISH